MGRFVRHTLELLICGAVGCYCFTRGWAVMPMAMAEVQVLFAAMFSRQRVIDAVIEEQ
jgi:hypothetical protein